MDNSAIDSFMANAGLAGNPESVNTLVEVEFLVTVLRLEPGQRLLDLPCGSGRHARLLGDKGVHVTAADTDVNSLAIARRDCAHPNVQYHQLDARSAAKLSEGFDAVSSLFSCIGYFEDDKQDEVVLRAMISRLKPGGRMVVSTANGTVVSRAGNTQTVFEPEDLRIERIDTYNEPRKSLERRFLILDKRSGEETAIHHRRRLYSPDELTELLMRCGINVIGCFGDYRGTPLDSEGSPHAIYVGECLS